MRPAVPSVLLLVSVAAGAGCGSLPGSAPPPQVVVRHRCGDTNFTDLNGTFGKLQGENGVNGKYRVRFATTEGALRAQWVPGGHARYGLEGRATGSDTAVFAEPGEGRRARVTARITSDCRIEAQWGWRNADGSEEKSVEPANLYVPFPDLANRDFEPCTEQLYIAGASRSWAAAKKVVASEEPTPVRSSTMPVAAWSDPSELGPGCTASFDVWTDGQGLDVVGAKTVEEADGRLRWLFDYENDYLGVHGVAMHRKVTCPGAPAKLLGVACVQVDVK